MAPKHRRNVLFTVPQDEWLEAEAHRLGISVPDLLRRIVDERRGARAGEADEPREDRA